MIQEIANNPKTGHVVGTVTAAIGSSTWFGWIPDDIGKGGTLVGIVLSLALIINHTRKEIHESKRRQLELRILEADADKKEAEVKARKVAGLPTRRIDD